MKDVLEPFSDIGAPATACWCECFNFEDSSRHCDEHKAALVAEVRRLRELVQSTHGLQLDAEAERDAAVAEAARVREALQAFRSPEAIERAAEALYEAGRPDAYTGDEWDWPNIDRAYDWDDEDDGDPEWLRNRYRSEARDVLDAVLPLVAQAIEEMPVYTDIGVIVRSWAARLVRSLAEGGQQQ